MRYIVLLIQQRCVETLKIQINTFKSVLNNPIKIPYTTQTHSFPFKFLQVFFSFQRTHVYFICKLLWPLQSYKRFLPLKTTEIKLQESKCMCVCKKNVDKHLNNHICQRCGILYHFEQAGKNIIFWDSEKTSKSAKKKTSENKDQKRNYVFLGRRAK